MPRKTKDGWLASIESGSSFRTLNGNRTSGILVFNAPIEGLFLCYEGVNEHKGVNNDVMFQLPDDPLVLRDLAAALIALANEQEKLSN
jgi:hypothetical protein